MTAKGLKELSVVRKERMVLMASLYAPMGEEQAGHEPVVRSVQATRLCLGNEQGIRLVVMAKLAMAQEPAAMEPIDSPIAHIGVLTVLVSLHSTPQRLKCIPGGNVIRFVGGGRLDHADDGWMGLQEAQGMLQMLHGAERLRGLDE